VRRDGRIDGVLAAQFSTRQLSAMLREPLPAGAVSSVTDGSGRIVARSQGFDRYFGVSATPDFLQLIRTDTRGVGVASPLGGGSLLAVWERLDSGWTVAIGVPVAVIEAPLRRSLFIAATVGLVLLAMGLAVSVVLSRRIAGAIDAAADDAHLLAQAHPVAPRTSGFRQIARLFRAHHIAGQQLARSTSDRDQAMRELQAEIQRREEFLAMLAHELRNPLAPLTNAHRLIERTGDLGDAARQALSMAQRQTGQLTRLVDDLLDVSRLTSGKTTLRIATVSMRDLVLDAAEATRPDAEAASQQLLVDVPDDPVMFACDAARIRQVLHNLLNNAVKFGREGGCIGISLHATDTDVTVEVTDDGIGIDADGLDQIFRPFIQIDPGLDRANGGLGLGLALVHKLVEMHGGGVTAHSDGLGTGSRFLVRLPRRLRKPLSTPDGA
jgi:signal transduction histidine kinase